ncbi:MAG: flagellar motor stator protein MotA [Minwuia sp.]|nr:flagellar motor stator protein MotA [Minwuia sp.]
MFFIVGVLIVIGSVLGGYLPHGSFAVLVQPLEVLIICGAAFGGFVISNPKTVIFGVFKSIGKILKGQPYNKAAYVELLTMQYTIYRLAKAKGMLALEAHIEDPEKSSIFTAFPNFMKNHHAVEFVCDYLRLMTMGTENAHEMEALMDEDIETHHHEQHAVASAITTVGDGLPAFGIVAAVLGVIVTMSSISEPPEVLGGLIAAALVGTFLGILLAYGFVAPMGKAMENYVESEAKYYQCLKSGMLAYLNGYAPAVSVEFARKTLYSHERPSFSELEEAVENAPKV